MVNLSKNPFTNLLAIRYPIVQAPTAPYAGPKLAAAVSNAGGLGSISAGLMTFDELADAIVRTRQLTDRPFNVNLFQPPPASDATSKEELIPSHGRAALAEAMNPLRAQVGLTSIGPEEVFVDNGEIRDKFNAVAQLVERERVPVVSIIYGMPDVEWVTRWKKAGIVVMGTATTVGEAKQMEADGVQALFVQGAEAGGHRGTDYRTVAEHGLVGTLPLTRAVAQAVKIPIISAGGIIDGQGIRAVMELGASGASLGTAFLNADESLASQAHKDAVLQPDFGCRTIVSRNFTGRFARGLPNTLTKALDEAPWHLKGAPRSLRSRDLASAAKSKGRLDLTPFFGGQAGGRGGYGSAANLVKQLAAEAGFENTLVRS